MQQHIYSKDPVQAAYTAGVFWLFQNAVVKDIEITSEGTALPSFDGNRKWISSRVSIPQTPALITYAGSLLVIIIAVALNEWARKDQRGLPRQLSPLEVAGMMANPNQYPRLSVRARVEIPLKTDRKEESTAPEKSGRDVYEFVIKQILLGHESAQVIAIEHRDTTNADDDDSSV